MDDAVLIYLFTARGRQGVARQGVGIGAHVLGKLIHRKASGTHSEYPTASGGAWRRSKYPRAEGGFMRVLGEIVAARCVDVTERETVREIASTISAGNT